MRVCRCAHAAGSTTDFVRTCLRSPAAPSSPLLRSCFSRWCSSSSTPNLLWQRSAGWSSLAGLVMLSWKQLYQILCRLRRHPPTTPPSVLKEWCLHSSTLRRTGQHAHLSMAFERLQQRVTSSSLPSPSPPSRPPHHLHSSKPTLMQPSNLLLKTLSHRLPLPIMVVWTLLRRRTTRRLLPATRK